MRGVSKTLIAATAALLLVLGLASCGGGDDSNSTATEAAAQGQAGDESSGGASSDGKANSGSGESSAAGGGGESSNGGSNSFVPKQHDDSGGGSEQFRVKGGDNSVQEFGAEADASELDEASAALHNFLDARAAEDWGAACEYLAASVAESLQEFAPQAKQAENSSCAETFAQLTNPAAMGQLREEAAKADVGSLRIESGRAFIIYRGLEGTVLAVPMTQEGGSWKVASLGGTPLS